MRQHLAILLMATVGLGGCTAVDEATEDHPVRAPGQSGFVVMPALGETIESVAERNDVSKDVLVQANHLKFPYILQPHQTLIVPPPASYRVHGGDTVAGIATVLGVDEIALARANGLQKPYHMTVGQVLTVPGGIGGVIAAPAKPVEPGFTGVAPAPRSSISTQTLAPPPGVAPGGTGQFGQIPPPPPVPPQPLAPQAQFVPPLSSPNALAPQLPPSRHVPPAAAPAEVAPGLGGAASAAPTAIIPSAPQALAPQALSLPKPVAPPPIVDAAPPGGAPHFIKPVGGQIVEGFGTDGSGQTNDGINIAAAAGTPVKASDAGTVIYTGNELAAFGNLILVRHAGGFVTAYGHLASIGVQRGQAVTQGQALGTVGQTGSATSPQLHFEIRQGSKPVDPAPYLNGGKG